MNHWLKPMALWAVLLAPVLILLAAADRLEITWRQPAKLAWLWTLPVLTLLFLWALARRERLASLFVQSRLLPDLGAAFSPQRQWLRMGIVLLALASVFLALARPRWGTEKVRSQQSTLDIVVAMDTSASMLASDLRPTRLEHAKLAAKELKRVALAERFALVPFAGTAFLQCPLTSEEEVFRQNVEVVRVGIIPQEGTSLAQVIATAQKAFVDEPEHHRVLVIFSDGEDHEGEAVEAARKAAKEGLKIFTIGVGTAAGDVMAIRQCGACNTLNLPEARTCEKCNALLGESEYLRDVNGAVAHTRLEETLLREVAAAGGGFYLPLQGTQTMQTLYKNGLAPLAESEDTGSVEMAVARDRYRWPLSAAAVLLLLEMFISTRRRNAGATSITPLTALIVGMFFVPAAQASPVDLYREKKFSEATEAFETLIKQSKQHTHLLHFNAGSAAFQTGDYQTALRHFNTALEAEDLALQQRAFFNLGNTHHQLGVMETTLEKRIVRWDEAAQYFSAAQKLDPKDKDAAANSATIQILLRRELDKLLTLDSPLAIGTVSAMRKKDAVLLSIHPPDEKAMPERPYWRLLVLDEYRNGVASISPRLAAMDSTGLHGTYHSAHGNREPAEEDPLVGEWRFQLEPMVTKHLPAPGPFETITLQTRRPYHYNNTVLHGRLAQLPVKAVRYQMTDPYGSQHVAAAPADRPLTEPPPLQREGYPWTTLDLDLTPVERRELQAIVAQVLNGQTLDVEAFGEAAMAWLHKQHPFSEESKVAAGTGDPVLRWMKSRDPGHSDLFAFAFQMLARAAGNPSRVVCGMVGAEFMQAEKRHVVRYKNIHVWNEIFTGTYWQRIDPIPPDKQSPPQSGDGQKPPPPNGQPQDPPGQSPNQPNGEPRNNGENPPQEGNKPDKGDTKLTPGEARELLEASRDQEKPLIFPPGGNELGKRPPPPRRPLKNW